MLRHVFLFRGSMFRCPMTYVNFGYSLFPCVGSGYHFPQMCVGSGYHKEVVGQRLISGLVKELFLVADLYISVVELDSAHQDSATGLSPESRKKMTVGVFLCCYPGIRGEPRSISRLVMVSEQHELNPLMLLSS